MVEEVTIMSEKRFTKKESSFDIFTSDNYSHLWGDEEEKNEESDSTTSFLTQLATWHKQELDEKLASRVQVSQRAVGKIIQVKLCKNQFTLR